LIDYTTALARIAVLSTGTGEELSGIEKTVSEAAGLFNTGMASAFRFGQDATLKHLTGTGVPPHAVRKLEEGGSSAWVALLAEEHHPLNFENAEWAPHREVSTWASTLGVSTIVFAPLWSESKLVGMLVLFHQGPYVYGPDECNILNVLATLMAGPVARLTPGDGEGYVSSKSQLFSVLSHELRTPLTSIMGFTQLIRKRLSANGNGDPRMMEQLDVLWAQAQRLNRLIDTFVDMARIERGEFEITRGKVELTGLIKSAAEQAVAQSSSHHTVSLDIPDRPLWMHGDSKRLEQVFGHIISNAVRYSPPQQPIAVSCESDSDMSTATIKITDHGPGIPPARLKEIFDRNYPSGPLKSGGLGVGLYLSKVIVEAHGGQIAVESSTGKGTSVTLVLPV